MVWLLAVFGPGQYQEISNFSFQFSEKGWRALHLIKTARLGDFKDNIASLSLGNVRLLSLLYLSASFDNIDHWFFSLIKTYSVISISSSGRSYPHTADNTFVILDIS